MKGENDKWSLQKKMNYATGELFLAVCTLVRNLF